MSWLVVSRQIREISQPAIRKKIGVTKNAQMSGKIDIKYLYLLWIMARQIGARVVSLINALID